MFVQVSQTQFLPQVPDERECLFLAPMRDWIAACRFSQRVWLPEGNDAGQLDGSADTVVFDGGGKGHAASFNHHRESHRGWKRAR